MIKIHIFYSETEAQMAREYLRANGIDAHIIGAKNYEAIVAGGGAGRYEMRVPEHEVDQARELLAQKTRYRPRLVKPEEEELDELVEPAEDSRAPLPGTVPTPAPEAVVVAMPAAEPAPASTFQPNYFRKSVMYALCALFLVPLVFNVVSLMNAKLYWQSAKTESDRTLKIFLLLILQIPGLVALAFLFSYLKSAFS